jgi:phosphosulfolactate phosphohydrolase-like enzyme
MEVVRLPPASAHAAPPDRLDVAVVIDVFRFTTTTAVLFSRGLAEALVIDTPRELALLPPHDYLIFSELSEVAARTDRVDNSPLVAANVDLRDRRIVLVTTNGTRALHVATSLPSLGGGSALLGSFLNARACAEQIRASGARRVALMPAGDFETGAPRIEDECCADALTALLAGDEPSFTALFERIRSDDRVRRRLERNPAFAEDLAIALQTDLTSAVPEARRAEDGLLRLWPWSPAR